MENVIDRISLGIRVVFFVLYSRVFKKETFWELPLQHNFTVYLILEGLQMTEKHLTNIAEAKQLYTWWVPWMVYLSDGSIFGQL